MCRAAGNTGLDEESRLKGEGLHEGGFLPTCPHLTWQVLSEAGGRGAGAFLQVSKTHPLSHSTPASLLACCFHYSHSHEVWCAVLQFAEHGSSSLFSPQALFSPGTGNQPKPQKALIHERKSTSLPGQWEAGDPRDSGSLGSGARGEGVCVYVCVCMHPDRKSWGQILPFLSPCCFRCPWPQPCPCPAHSALCPFAHLSQVPDPGSDPMAAHQCPCSGRSVFGVLGNVS